MTEPAPADEAVVETEPGVDPNLQLNPHLGHQDPDQKPEGSQEDKDGDNGPCCFIFHCCLPGRLCTCLKGQPLQCAVELHRRPLPGSASTC